LLLLYFTRFSVKVREVQKEFQVADPGGTLGLDERPRASHHGIKSIAVYYAKLAKIFFCLLSEHVIVVTSDLDLPLVGGVV